MVEKGEPRADKEDQRAQRKACAQMVVRARLYGLFALILAGVGALLFLYTFFGVYGGNLAASGAGVGLVAVLVVPFAPAGILALLARGADRRAKSLLAALRA